MLPSYAPPAHVATAAARAQDQLVLLAQISCCSGDRLCAMHREDLWKHLRGVAACRGEFWAMAIAKRIDRSVPWPTGSDKVMLVARMKVEDLTRDPGLRELLAAELARWAERWWSTPA